MPTTTGVGKLRWNPSVKSWPRPPSPMYVATLTSEIDMTVAIRTPAMITGRARGSSTVSRMRSGRVPIALAASLVRAGTESRPSTVLRRSTTSV